MINTSCSIVQIEIEKIKIINNYGFYFYSVGDLEDDEDDLTDSENENAITDSEDEDDCYQNTPDQKELNIMEELRFGCMKQTELVTAMYETNHNGNGDDDQYHEPLQSNTTVDFHGKGLKGL